jgi:DNA-binding transcriptional LysR family regulator
MQLKDRIGRKLKLRDLNILLAVTQTGSMIKAARLLSVSHPVISKSIADLERTFGVRFFDRTSSGVEPTQFGYALLKRSISVFDELKQSVNEIEFLADPSAGTLSVGASEPVAAGILPAIIARLSRKHPRLTYHIEQGDALTLQRRDLRERKVEFVIARMLGPVIDPDMEANVLFYEKLLVVAGVQSKWVGRRKIALRELVNESWILAPLETMPDSPFVDAFRAIGLDAPAARVLVYSLPLRASLLATGEFITLVPGSVLRFGGEHMSLKVLPVQLPDWQLPVAIITLKNRALSPLAQTFIECARDVVKPLVKRP